MFTSKFTAYDRGCVKTPLLPENGCAQHDFRRLAHLRSLRMLENSMVIGMFSHSPEFSHSLGPIADAPAAWFKQTVCERTTAERRCALV